MVRDWLDGSLADLTDSVSAWFADLSIVDRRGGHVHGAPPLRRLLGSLLAEGAKWGSLPPSMGHRLWRAAIKRRPIPRAVLLRAHREARLAVLRGDPMRPERMALIKAFHLRAGDQQMTATLNEVSIGVRY